MIRDEHIITEEEAVFPPTPFLLVAESSVGVKYFIVESWEVSDIHVLKDYHFSQTIEGAGHKATEEEIKHFSGDETK